MPRSHAPGPHPAHRLFEDERAGRGRGARGPRPLGHGDLRLLLLAMIETQPRHGYELIRAVAELFHGLYTPSAGTVYPTLAQLEAQGLVQADADATRKRYAITAAGQAFVQAERAQVEAALHRTHHSARALVRANVPAPVREAMHRIKHGLLARHGRWDPDEIERVAALLHAAADGMDGSNS
ncbi:PadR family transcriptional regulator [Xanthomonas sacchari]|uniref:PadR family transcriptional regulator n=1 Tax=Xanthomonas sacchari TaxID=56458 RepID=A0A2P5YYC8_9XANT|nr:PadR family transcriptional regulator [Xanthomonas sacchari]MDV0440763.1 PadR family transcriptional regulator [Xanthomonas sacchari]PPU79484.1 PadR family transcriptional regulator [Xanthomonas sacchari]